VTPPKPAVRRLGVAVLVVYALAGALTLRMTGHALRPLFEGVGPTSPYRWVAPPPEFAASNVKPEPATTDIELDDAGTKPLGFSTPDGQVVVNLPAGAVAPRAGDTKVVLSITPLDPATVGGVPDGRPNGNAYRIQATYQPSGTAVDRFAKPGNLVFGMPEPFQVLLYAPDGRAWEPLAKSANNGPATDSRIGYFLGTTGATTVPPQRQGSGSNGGVVVVVIVVVALALLFGLGPPIYRRLRARHASAPSGLRPPSRTGANRPKATAKKKKPKKHQQKRR
jgi:hypothetical protein